MTTSHIRNGRCAARPYLFATSDAEAFVTSVFDATVLARHETPGGAHLEIAIEDAIVVIEAADQFPEHVETTTGSAYVYVPDVDKAYASALAAGATSIAAPEDKPYDERQCGVKDTFGNTWWISAYTGT